MYSLHPLLAALIEEGAENREQGEREKRTKQLALGIGRHFSSERERMDEWSPRGRSTLSNTLEQRKVLP